MKANLKVHIRIATMMQLILAPYMQGVTRQVSDESILSTHCYYKQE